MNGATRETLGEDCTTRRTSSDHWRHIDRHGPRTMRVWSITRGVDKTRYSLSDDGREAKRHGNEDEVERRPSQHRCNARRYVCCIAHQNRDACARTDQCPR